MPQFHDIDSCPQPTLRDLCINCGDSVFKHNGWACNPRCPRTKKSQLAPNERFRTADMIGQDVSTLPMIPVANTVSTNEPEPVEAKSEHPNEWKAWRDHGLQANECVCRIPRDRCEYHR